MTPKTQILTSMIRTLSMETLNRFWHQLAKPLNFQTSTTMKTSKPGPQAAERFILSHTSAQIRTNPQTNSSQLLCRVKGS